MIDDTEITMFRGYPIRIDPTTGKFIFCDTGDPTVETWEDRPCGHCSKQNTPEGHDGCLGTLGGGVVNACCGHGDADDAYVQFDDGSRLGGEDALIWIDSVT